MLDGVSYPLNIARARLGLTDAPAAPPAGPAGRRRLRNGYGIFVLLDDFPLEMHFNLSNLYLEGFRNSGGQLTVTRGSNCAVAPNRVLPYGNDYPELGYSRLSAITISLGGLYNSVSAVWRSTTATPADNFKPHLVNLAIGFAEAMRFDDVLTAVLNGTPIADLDWDKHQDQSKVRIAKN